MNMQLNSEFNWTDISWGLGESIGRSQFADLHNVLNGKKIIFTCFKKNHVPVGGWGLDSNQEQSIRTITPVKEISPVAAVDSSSITLAETEDGLIYAAKCGIAFALNGDSTMHLKIGPILFYLNDQALKESTLDYRLARLILSDQDSANRMIRLRVERSVQTKLSNQLARSIIVIDGALRTSPYETTNQDIAALTEMCLIRNNTLIGISKNTSFKALSRISMPLAKTKGTVYSDVGMIIQSLSRNSIGKNLLVKLGDGPGPVLRADIVCANGNLEASFGKFIANDSMAGGYPETLRIAHHISTFTNTEISCLRSYLMNNYNLEELHTEDIRKTLLGSIPA
jgi:hypothetical protein